MSRTGLDAETLARSLRARAGDGSIEWVYQPIQTSVLLDVADLLDENAKLREQLERVQPTDCEGNVLDIADTVSMLRSEYDGDHEWEDVVTELVLTKWGGDRWIVRGSKGEAWACDCTKTGYDEDAYEASDDVEPFDEPTLLEVENTKLRGLMARMAEALGIYCEWAYPNWCKSPCVLEFGCWPNDEHADIRCPAWAAMQELGIEVDE